MGLIVRVVDEMRFGLRDVNVDEVIDLARAWSELNQGQTPSEAVLRLLNHSE
ncbi:MAG: hypothetical protein M3P34_11035 [Actinomycetota bacterium]|nr:hypothetical protein [Actinomycetota bacterium]